MNNIDLSIIIPVYNGEKYIEKMLKSLILDELYNTEIIIVNDGSTDSTKSICEKYENISLYNISNHGVSYARNFGLENSRGKYIMFVDADDLMSENWFSIVSKYFNKDYDIVYFSENLDSKISKLELTYRILNIKQPVFGAPFSKMFNRKLLINNSISFNSEIISAEDMLFNMKCLSITDNYFIDTNSFYLYRVYTGSSTKRFDDKIFNSCFVFNDEIKNVINSMNFELNEKEFIIDNCTNDIITLISNRIAFVKPYKDAKSIFKMFNEDKYRNVINEELKCKYLRKMKKLVLRLCKHKMYFLVYLLYRTRIIIKLFNKKETFISI